MIALAPTFTQRHYNWTAWKAVRLKKYMMPQYEEDTSIYTIWGYDGPEVHICQIYKGEVIQAVLGAGYTQEQNDLDKTDFETNFKPTANGMLDIKDSDGAPLSRGKITQTGWAYQLHSIEFESAKLDGTVGLKEDGTSWGFITSKFYKSVSGVETLMVSPTQEELDADCIKTIVDWEPTHDYEIMGGFLKQATIPTENIRMWVVGVPDVPYAYGGSKVFVSSLNLKFMSLDEGVKVDGRAPKYLTYSATYHTNKMRIIMRHPAGLKHKACLVMEIFKP